MPLPQTQVTCLQRRENADFKRGWRGGGLAVHKYFLILQIDMFVRRSLLPGLMTAWAEEVLRRSTNELLLMRFRQKL